jgi:hypothetical protein
VIGLLPLRAELNVDVLLGREAQHLLKALLHEGTRSADGMEGGVLLRHVRAHYSRLSSIVLLIAGA